MPIKKKLPTSQPSTTPKPRAAKPAPKQVQARVQDPPPKKSTATKHAPKVELGPRLDPATLPGANESAPSLAGQKYLFRYSTAPNNSAAWQFETGGKTNTALWCWRQCGAAVVFEYQSCRYLGRFDGETMRGTAQNSSGASWEWSASLAPAGDKSYPMSCYHDPF